ESITPGPAGQPVTVTPTALPAPVVQITSPLSAPDPIGLAAALKVLGTPDIFRDMSGTKELEDLLKGLSSGAMGLADAQKLADKVSKDLAASQGAKTPSGPKADTPTEPNPSKQVDKLDVIDYGRSKGLLTDEAAQRAAEGVVGGRLLASADA